MWHKLFISDPNLYGWKQLIYVVQRSSIAHS